MMFKKSVYFKSTLLFGLNLLLIGMSLKFCGTPQRDEYLVLFLISLVFILAPFVMSKPMVVSLFVMNLVFFIIYGITNVLDRIDIFVFMGLFAGTYGGGYLLKSFFSSFLEYQDRDIAGRRKTYNVAVSELESIERRGRKIENELIRISRLYKITKKLAPILKLEDLLEALFNFLEENFKFETVHLLTFKNEKFFKGISKSMSNKQSVEDKEEDVDYEEIVKYVIAHGSESFFVDRAEGSEFLDNAKIRSDQFMIFPLFIGKNLCAMLAVEGSSKASYGRFRLLISQIALEFRKVQLYEKVQELSIVDGLTEVYLRRYLMDRLEEEVDRANRLGLTFSIGMVDVDHFKECNDKYGHLVGDAVLKKIAERLKGSVREVDMIARYGGEEFCVVLPETSKQLAMTVSERLRNSIESKGIKAFDEEIKKTVSVGIATYPEDGNDVDSLIEKADTALYKAKRKGRNLVCSA